MDEFGLDGEKLQKLLAEIISLEKTFINDKAMNEKKKLQEMKQLIEKEVKLDAD